jgi:hypothetical protein
VKFIDRLNCLMLRYHVQQELLLVFNIGSSEIVLAEELPEGIWECIFDSEDDPYGGLGKIFPERLTEDVQTRIMSVPPWAFAVYSADRAAG